MKIFTIFNFNCKAFSRVKLSSSSTLTFCRFSATSRFDPLQKQLFNIIYRKLNGIKIASLQYCYSRDRSARVSKMRMKRSASL